MSSEHLLETVEETLLVLAVLLLAGTTPVWHFLSNSLRHRAKPFWKSTCDQWLVHSAGV